jgi:hypothetical protein
MRPRNKKRGNRNLRDKKMGVLRMGGKQSGNEERRSGGLVGVHQRGK